MQTNLLRPKQNESVAGHQPSGGMLVPVAEEEGIEAEFVKEEDEKEESARTPKVAT